MIAVLLNHPRFLIINKPPGIGMHQEAGEPGLVTLAKHLLELPELYPVHRLDKITSGALILAKDTDANRELSSAFRERLVEKYYLAISSRRPAKKQGLIVGDMERSRRASWKFIQSQHNPAVTQFISGSFATSLRWFVLRPATGKTHQLRVALKSLGSPVLGDPLYGGQIAPSDAVASLDRAYLHAWGIRFRFGGDPFEVLAPPEPGVVFQHPNLAAALARLGQPWNQPWPPLPPRLRTAIGKVVGNDES